MGRKRLNFDEVRAFTDALDGLMQANGAWDQGFLEGGHGHRTYKRCADLIQETLHAIENAFCRMDATAYAEWALRLSVEGGFRYEPCDEWFNAERGPWPADALPIEKAKAGV